MNIKESKTPAHVVQMSILLGFFLSVSLIVLTFIPPSEEGVDSGGWVGISYAACAMMLFAISGLSGLMRLKNISIYSVLLSILLIFMYQYTETHIGMPKTPFLGYLCYAVISFLLPCFVRIDVRLFLKAIMVFSLPAIFRISLLFLSSIRVSGEVSMGYSYIILTPVIASIVYKHFYYKDEPKQGRLLTTICFFVNLIYAGFLIAYGTRGAVLAIFSLIVVMHIVKFDSKEKRVTIVAKKAFFYLFIGVLIIISLIPFLTFLNSFLGSLGIHVLFLDKSLDLDAGGGVSSGRDLLYLMTIEAIAQKPYLGYGIDQFENNFNEVYPHNFILQLLYDGGIFLALIVLVPVILKIIKTFKECSYDEYAVFMALFFASVPAASLSGDLWTQVVLWVFFGAALSKQFVYQQKGIH